MLEDSPAICRKASQVKMGSSVPDLPTLLATDFAIIGRRMGCFSVREPRFTDRGQGDGQEDRPPSEHILSPLSGENVEPLNLAIPALDPRIETRGEPSRAEQNRQIDLILASRSFRNAPLLQKFLSFITSESAEGRHEELNEYVIATRVFGRPADFDPAADTIVRTQAYRLRTKLKEYYENEGRAERVQVEVPKGRYVPLFSLRDEPQTALIDREGAEDHGAKTGGSPWLLQQSRLTLAAIVVLVAGVSFAAGAFYGARRISLRPPPTAAQNVPAPLGTFWGEFAGGGGIILAYTNAVFLETETADLLRFRNSGAIADRGAVVGKELSRADALNPGLAAHAGTLYYEESFTGTGEVLATYRLANLLSAMGAKVQVKRSRLLTVDDLRNHDVIFLGSPFENQVLAEMHLRQRFSFEQPAQPPYLWRGRIVDHKTPGVSYGLERDPQSHVIRADYALFDVLPGPAPGRRIIVLAGITTSGTQGAAEFATSADGLRQILALEGSPRDSSGNKEIPRYFESVLRVEAEKGLEAINVKFVDGSVVQMQQ